MNAPGPDRQLVTDLVRELVAAIQPALGVEFLRALVVQLNRALGVSHAQVADHDPAEPGGLRTLARSENGQLVANTAYRLEGSPCEQVLRVGRCTVTRELRQKFPRSELWSNLSAESYSGTRLFDVAGAPIGLVAVLHGEPLPNPAVVEAVIGELAARVAAEVDRFRGEEALRRSEIRHRTLVQHAPMCIHELDRGLRILTINAAGLRILAPERTEAVVGRSWLDFIASWDRERVERLLREAFRGRSVELDFSGMVQGEPRILTANYVPARGADSTVTKLLGFAQDVTERKQSEERLVYLAEHDGLTQLPNRGLFMDRLRSGIARAKRNGSLLALLFVDLNNFKPVNDQYGHQVGDRLLRAVAERLRSAVREVDTVARIGGDEFAIILEAISDAGDAANVAVKISSVVAQPFFLDGMEINIGASTGIALYPTDGADANDLLKHADAEMYRMKRSDQAF